MFDLLVRPIPIGRTVLISLRSFEMKTLSGSCRFDRKLTRNKNHMLSLPNRALQVGGLKGKKDPNWSFFLSGPLLKLA